MEYPSQATVIQRSGGAASGMIAIIATAKVSANRTAASISGPPRTIQIAPTTPQKTTSQGSTSPPIHNATAQTTPATTAGVIIHGDTSMRIRLPMATAIRTSCQPWWSTRPGDSWITIGNAVTTTSAAKGALWRPRTGRAAQVTANTSASSVSIGTTIAATWRAGASPRSGCRARIVAAIGMSGSLDQCMSSPSGGSTLGWRKPYHPAPSNQSVTWTMRM